MASRVKAGRAFVELSLNDKMSRSLDAAGQKLKSFGSGVARIGAGVGAIGASVAAAFAGTAKYFANTGDEVAKMSKRTGVAVDVLSELSFVASQSGTDFASLENGFRKMQRSIYDAGRGVTTYTDILKELGLNVKDLDGLTPEKQFKLFADRIGKIKDSTKQAAIAMTVFGRTGTNLLPMFQQGAEGISALQKEARRLGITMSKEDAVAAEELLDAFDALNKVIGKIMFSIGAAVSGPFKSLLQYLSEIGAATIRLVEDNEELIKTALYLGVVIAGVGGAIAAVGLSIAGLGAFLSLASIGVSALGAAFAAIISPIGLFVIAVAGIGAYILTSTEIGAKALDWLGEKFDSILNKVKEVTDGIGDALSAGKIGLAVKVLWTSINLEFAKGAAYINSIWETVYAEGAKVWDKIAFGALTSFDYLVVGLKNLGSSIIQVFLGVGKFIANVFNAAVGGIVSGITYLIGKIAKAAYELDILNDKEIVSITATVKGLKEKLTPDQSKSNKFYDDAIKSLEIDKKDRNKAFDDRQTDRQLELAASPNKRDEAAQQDINAALLAKKAAELDYKTALGEAKESAEIKRAQDAIDAAKVEDVKTSIPSAKDVSKTTSTALGTFSAAAISQSLGGSKSVDVTAKNTTKLVEETQKTNALLKNQQGLAFS